MGAEAVLGRFAVACENVGKAVLIPGSFWYDRVI